MNYTHREGKSPFRIIFTLILFFTISAMLFKPVMRWFYPAYYLGEIKKYSTMYDLSDHLVMAVISTESKFDKLAVSSKDAKGLMQLREETAKWCMEEFKIDARSRDIYNPSLNIEIGCAYLKYLTDKFEKNKQNALAAYNAGEGNVKKWLGGRDAGSKLGSIPFEETKKYIELVEKREKIYRFLY